MGRYDDITPERLRAELVRFARLLLTMEDEGEMLEKTPALLERLGELRQMLFAHEVRGTRRLASPGGGKQARAGEGSGEESLRVVREAVERERRFLEELGRSLPDEERGE